MCHCGAEVCTAEGQSHRVQMVILLPHLASGVAAWVVDADDWRAWIGVAGARVESCVAWIWTIDDDTRGKGWEFRGKAEGVWHWVAEEQLRWESIYRGGKLDGLSTSWYNSAYKMSEETYRNGVEHGLSTSWWENGSKFQEGIYCDGEKVGIWTEWNSSGISRVL